MSFSLLPIETVGAILSFVPDPQTIFRFACTCHDYSTFVSGNETLWRNLYRHNWKRVGKLPIRRNSWRNSCVLRCQFDVMAAQLVNRMANSMCARRDKQQRNSLLAVAVFWHPDDNTWSNLMRLGVNVLEACLKMHTRVVSDLLMASFRDKCIAYVAATAAYHLELANCFKECFGLYQNPFVDDDELMEQYAIRITMSSLTMEEFLAAGGGASVEREVTHQLDSIASALLARLEAAKISTNDTTLAVGELCKIFFTDLGMRSNMFVFRHILLHRALRHKTGTHITNAVILKSICRRVGIQVDILCYRKFILLGVPSKTLSGYDCFFNVMAHDSFSPTKCRVMAERIGYDWHSIVNSARSSFDVLQLFVKTQLQLAAPFLEKSHLLFHVRSTLIWRSILTEHESILDPPKVTYVPCLDLAGSLDDGAQI